MLERAGGGALPSGDVPETTVRLAERVAGRAGERRPRQSVAPTPPVGSAELSPSAAHLPLWLTEREAEALLALCAASRTAVPEEPELLDKLAELLRAFWR